ncbi:MAG: hypothetical protein H0U26_02185 [Acidimicrobiia bacterium]|nr:hypothetical protein [Acidimicrobiia bacterium]
MSSPRPFVGRTAIAALGVALAALVVAACGTIGAFLDLQEALEGEGFSDVSVNLGSGDGLAISGRAPSSLDRTEAENRAAEIAWTEFPRRFDTLTVELNGGSRAFDRQELEAQFGPRPAGLDDKELEDDVRNISVGLIIALVAGAVLCLGLIILVVVLVRRSGRKKRERFAAAYPGYGQAGGYPPPGGGYGGPPPAAPPQQPPGWG